MSDEVHFPAGTDLTMAKAIALKEFPNRCQVRVEDNDEPHCLLVDVRSPKVEAVIERSRPTVAQIGRAHV